MSNLSTTIFWKNQNWKKWHALLSYTSVLELIRLDEWIDFDCLIAGWQCPTPQEDHLHAAKDSLHAYSGKLLGIDQLKKQINNSISMNFWNIQQLLGRRV